MQSLFIRNSLTRNNPLNFGLIRNKNPLNFSTIINKKITKLLFFQKLLRNSFVEDQQYLSCIKKNLSIYFLIKKKKMFL